MGYSKHCPKCRGSGARWGWLGFFLLLPFHLLEIFTRSFYVLGWIILVVIAVLIPAIIFDDKYEYVKNLPEHIAISATCLVTIIFLVTLKTVFKYIRCKECNGTGSTSIENDEDSALPS